MTDFIKILLSLSVSGSFLIAILLLMKPLYKNRLSQKWQYYIWLVVILRLLFPFTIDFNIMENIYEQVYSEIAHMERESNVKSVKEKTDSLSIDSMDDLDNAVNTGNIQNAGAENPKPVKKWMVQLFLIFRNNVFYIWLVIALIIFIRKITIYQGFIKYLNAGCIEVNSLYLWEEMGNLLEKSHIKSTVRLSINNQVSSPLLTGFFHPCIILPSGEPDKTDFKNIICHELTHFKRKDMFYKWIVQLTVCIHWFNPFVYFIVREVDRLCELSCDEAVIKKLDSQGKKEYGNTLLKMADTRNTLKNSIASVTLGEGKKLLKERLERIMEFKKKTIFCTLLSAVLTFMLCITASAMGSVSLSKSDNEIQSVQNTVKDNLFQKASKSNDKEKPIDKLIARNRVILEAGIYHILCDGVTKADMSNGGVSDGCIGITLEQSDGGYVSIGPIDLKKDLDGLVEYTKKVCRKYVRNKTMTQEDTQLMIGLAEKLVTGNGKIKGIKDIKSASYSSEYKKWNIQKKNGVYYYKNKRVRIFIDLRADKSFVELSYDKKGTVNVKITRNKKGKISKVKLISNKTADKFLEG